MSAANIVSATITGIVNGYLPAGSTLTYLNTLKVNIIDILFI